MIKVLFNPKNTKKNNLNIYMKMLALSFVEGFVIRFKVLFLGCIRHCDLL